MAHEAELPSSWPKVWQGLHVNSLWILPLGAWESAVNNQPIWLGIAVVAWFISAGAAVKYHLLQKLWSKGEGRQRMLTWTIIFAGAAFVAYGIYRLADRDTGAAAKAVPAQITQPALNETKKTQPIFIKDASVGFSGRPNQPGILVGRTAVTADRLRFFVQYGIVGQPFHEPPIPIGAFGEVTREQPFEFPIIYRTQVSGGNEKLTIGLGHEPLGVDPTAGRPQWVLLNIMVIGPDNTEQNLHFVFLYMPSSPTGSTIFFDYEGLDAVGKWMAQ
jgi:hypothetical protein